MPPFFYSYLITDPDEYGSTPEKLGQALIKSFSNHTIDMVCFRDKTSRDIEPLAKTCLDISRKFNIPKVLINGNIELALKLGFDGVHLTSKQFDEIKKAKENKLFTIISTHSEEEINLAKRSGADAVTYSPIFYKENKGSPKGCIVLKTIVKKYQDDSFDIFALGGIVSDKEVKEVKQTDARGFASIRYFN